MTDRLTEICRKCRRPALFTPAQVLDKRLTCRECKQKERQERLTKLMALPRQQESRTISEPRKPDENQVHTASSPVTRPEPNLVRALESIAKVPALAPDRNQVITKESPNLDGVGAGDSST